MTQTFVCVIGPASGPQKIGIAKSVQIRRETLQTGSAFDLSIHYQWPMQDELSARRAEKMAHRLLAEHRRRGEWFDVAPARAVEVLRIVATSMGCGDDGGERLEMMRDCGQLSWDEYEAAVAYQEVCAVARKSAYGHSGRGQGSMERTARAVALSRRLDEEVLRRSDAPALKLLRDVTTHGTAPTEEELPHLRKALGVVADLLERTISAASA